MQPRGQAPSGAGRSASARRSRAARAWAARTAACAWACAWALAFTLERSPLPAARSLRAMSATGDAASGFSRDSIQHSALAMREAV